MQPPPTPHFVCGGYYLNSVPTDSTVLRRAEERFPTDKDINPNILEVSLEEEDEVFIGPVKHVERCVAKSIDLNIQKSGESQRRRSKQGLWSWSPLSADKLEEISREANRLAMQLEKSSLKENTGIGDRNSPLGEARAKLRVLKDEQEYRKSSRSPRRETYLVKNSPVKSLLPSVDTESVCVSPLAWAHCEDVHMAGSTALVQPRPCSRDESLEKLSKRTATPSSPASNRLAQDSKTAAVFFSSSVFNSLTCLVTETSVCSSTTTLVHFQEDLHCGSTVKQKENTSVASSVSAHQNLNSSLAGRPGAAPIALHSEKSNTFRERTGIPAPVSRLPTLSAMLKPSAKSGGTSHLQPPSDRAPSGNGLARPGSLTQPKGGLRAPSAGQSNLPTYANRSRLVPPKKATQATER
ncbi:GTSE1 protein, partial [Polyodon spathula]|nr:GTSE1 protein [Polyodon spathula]